MDKAEVLNILKNNLKFPQLSLKKIEIYGLELLKYNLKYNLISKSTEYDIWKRHFLDSAQLVKFINFKDGFSLSDLGSGGGFPGLVLAIYNANPNFHVKIYEKSPVKVKFMKKITKLLDIRCTFFNNDINYVNLSSNFIVCRAFKKLSETIRISRENIQKPNKLIILKGKNAQDEVKKALKQYNFSYKLHDSISDADSKILVVENL